MPDLQPILDTHQHLILAKQWPYSWTASEPALAGRAFDYGDYCKAIESTGITRSIFMETTPDEPHPRMEATFVAEMNAPMIRGVIANCRPEAAGFEEYVESLRSPRLVGFRRILHVEPDELSRTPLFPQNLRWLGKQHFTFDLCVRARQIPLAMDLIRQCPDTQFILDHCGNPDIAADAGKGPAKAWHEGIIAIAALPNVACKISGIAANCASGTVTADLLRPYVEHCLEIFGWDRVVWGSDWPVCLTRTTLATWVAITRNVVANADAGYQRKLFEENAAKIYGLKR